MALLIIHKLAWLHVNLYVHLLRSSLITALKGFCSFQRNMNYLVKMFEIRHCLLKMNLSHCILQCRLQREESLIFRVVKTKEVSGIEKVHLLFFFWCHSM
jgi:hypothetical protein